MRSGLRRRTSTAGSAPRVNELFIPAQRMSLYAGTPVLSQFGAVGIWGWLFDDTVDEGVTFETDIPAHWAALTADLRVTKMTTNNGNVRWQGRCYSIGDGDTETAGLASLPTLTLAAPVVQYRPNRQQIGGSAAVDPTKIIRTWVQRVGSSANDTLTGDVALLGVHLRAV